MSLEIERKFLLGSEPPTEGHRRAEHIRQGYLAEEGEVELRLRISDQRSVITIKAGRGMSRTEVEVEIAPGDAEELWQFTAGRRLEKTRHRIDLGELTAELDIFEGDLAGTSVVEVEFESAEAAERFVPPAWFGEELTGRAEWSNSALARHGLPRR